MEYILPDLCDAHAQCVTVVTPMFLNFGGKISFGGEIVTIKCHQDNSWVARQVEEKGDGRVLVVDGGGSLRCALLGDNLAEKAVKNGWEGIVVYGCIRDVDVIGKIALGVQALAANPMKSVKRDTGQLNIPVSFGGVTFTPGQYIYGDNNGLIVSTKKLEMP